MAIFRNFNFLNLIFFIKSYFVKCIIILNYIIFFTFNIDFCHKFSLLIFHFIRWSFIFHLKISYYLWLSRNFCWKQSSVFKLSSRLLSLKMRIMSFIKIVLLLNLMPDCLKWWLSRILSKNTLIFFYLMNPLIIINFLFCYLILRAIKNMNILFRIFISFTFWAIAILQRKLILCKQISLMFIMIFL